VERDQVAIAIAAQLLDLWKEIGVMQAAIEERDRVPPLQGGLRQAPPEKERATENEQPHCGSLSPSHFASSLIVPTAQQHEFPAIRKPLEGHPQFV